MKTIFIIVMSIFFGFTMEVLSSAIHNFIDKKNKILIGEVSLWMAIPYGLLFTFLFIPFSNFISFLPDYIRLVIYGFSFMIFEFTTGYMFHKILKFVPWDYSHYDDCVTCLKLTRWGLWPLWGFAGLWLESYFKFVLYLSQFIQGYF